MSNESRGDKITAYVDITEPKTARGLQGARYIINFVEDGDETVYAEVLNRKNDALLSITNYLNRYPHINALRVDNAGELTSNAVKDRLMEKIVGLETIAPGVSQSNGKIERKHLHLKQVCEKLMADCGCDMAPELWPWFIVGAVNAINASWNTKIHGVPQERLRRRLGISRSRCPYAVGDVVNFFYKNEEKSLETGVNGNRIGLFLGENHSGSFCVLCVNNERATRFEIHPNQVNNGVQERKDEVVQHIKWA